MPPSVTACARLYASLAYGEAITTETEFYAVLEMDGGNNVVRAARPVTGGLVGAGVTTGVSFSDHLPQTLSIVE